ncbi:MAG TPA: ADP-ribosylglycohydrolase family protein [Chloroflexia bacterium]|nr:ADP-ribosylglycohydrolase family protein [Chloroflexia bacterium]
MENERIEATKPSVARYRGCLFGLAIGDALGASIEFMTLSQIKGRFGEQGVTGPAGPLQYTDDTQMSLATAVGCMRAWVRYTHKGICHPPSLIYRSYLAWLATQDDPRQQRAPGKTCLTALRSGTMGTMKKPINNSKGCGGVMRTAPIGLSFLPDVENGAFQIGAESAALTHGHPSGYLTGGFLAEMVAHLVRGSSLEDAIDRSVRLLVRYEGHEEALAKVEQARRLAGSEQEVERSITELGAGWVGEEALAIAIYCALKFPDDWRKGVLAAANHSGDSDSTASICGAILGTHLGLRAIPGEWVRSVENAVDILAVADDMYLALQKGEKQTWELYVGY